MLVLLLFLLCPVFRFEKFQDLALRAGYTKWSTEGNLTPKFFRVLVDPRNPPTAIRVSVTCENVTLQNPLTVNIIRGKTVHDIALPRVQSHQGQKFTYWFATDTLCDDDRSIDQLSQPVYLSIASSLPTDFEILVKSAVNFLIEENPFEMYTRAAEPRYYMYTFPEGVEKVDVRAYSDSQLCGRLIVRRADCPLFDGSGLLELSGVYFYQTFTTFAGFTLKKSEIGPQFHLALTVLPDDSLCGTHSPNNTFAESERIKHIRYSVIPVEEQNLLLILPIIVYGVSMAIVLLLTFLKYKLLDRYENNEPKVFENSESDCEIPAGKLRLFDKPTLIVSHFEYQKQRLVKDSKYFNFLFFQIFGSILPALTTLFQNYQQSSNKMNLDICYLNYMCSLEMLNFNTFNSIASVSSLAVIGILNLIIVFRKKIFRYQIPRLPTTHGIQQREASKVVCLLSLVAMGMLGIITNNCPGKSTSHLYVYTCLWIFFSAIMWIYSKRHGVRKWQQFYIIATSSIFGCLTLAENMFDLDDCSRIILKIFFLSLSVSATGYWCYQYYFERPSGLQGFQWINSPFRKPEKVLGAENGVYQPLKSKSFYVVLAMAQSVFWPMKTLLLSDSITGALFKMGKGQLLVYLLYYVIQKIRFERSTFTTSYKIFGFTLVTVFVFSETVVNFILASYLNTYDSSLTPAKSRELNQDCVLPGIDWNDIRHYNCALNWFLFIVLMDFIDSNIKRVPKKHIFVF